MKDSFVFHVNTGLLTIKVVVSTRRKRLEYKEILPLWTKQRFTWAFNKRSLWFKNKKHRDVKNTNELQNIVLYWFGWTLGKFTIL